MTISCLIGGRFRTAHARGSARSGLRGGGTVRRAVIERLEDRALLAITLVNHAPTLETLGEARLAPVAEGQHNPGVLVEEIVGSRTSDADLGSRQGIAVFQADDVFGDAGMDWFLVAAGAAPTGTEPGETITYLAD